MKDTEQTRYQKRVQQASPPSPALKNCTFAFLIGGAICTLGQGISEGIKAISQAGAETASLWTSMILVFLGALFTGIGWYDTLAKYAGAGTLVPITGFSNAVVSPALEYKTEGYITGVGAKMFIVAGPVLVYGVVTSVFLGLCRYLLLRAGVLL